MVRASMFGSRALLGYGSGSSLNGPDGAWAWTSRTNATAATAAEPAMNFRRVKDATGSNDMGFLQWIMLLVSLRVLSQPHADALQRARLVLGPDRVPTE